MSGRRTRRALAAAGTIVALVAMETADARAPRSPTDNTRDDGTTRIFAAALSTAIGITACTVLRRRRVAPGTRFVLGLATVWGGMALNRWARHTLGAAYRSRLTVVADHTVVSAGPYRWVRHPMYLGSTVIFAGAAVTLGSPRVALAWMVPVGALAYRITVEERMLRDTLGPAYAEFTQGRARLVPCVW